MTSTTWTIERAKIAALSRSRAADDPEIIEARRNLKALRLEDHIREIVDSEPPLSRTQREHLASILAGGGAKC